jgi:hypothetical protein
MFGIFKKKQKSNKSELENAIEMDGIEHAAKRFSEIILQKIQTNEIAYQFILAEIEAASLGNDVAITFARNSGISPKEYNGSIRNSKLEVDQLQLFLNQICSNISSVELIVDLRTKIDDNIMKLCYFGKYTTQQAALKGGLRLKKAEVEILFIVRNDSVIYVNSEADHLFEKDKDGNEKMNGRVVNFIFSGQPTQNTIEMFVAFDDSYSYTRFDLQTEKLNYVAQTIFKYFAEVGIRNVFSPIENYSTQYIYTFKLYRKNGKYFMINISETQAYLIDKSSIKRDGVDEIKNIFWGISD